MKDVIKLKLFISYSHNDEVHIKEFIRHIAPLKTNGLIEDWYDRRIIAGKDYQNTINNKLEDADIICLFLSSNFLSSDSCMKEKDNAFELMKKKGIAVVPIILSFCGWLDDRELSPLLALPTDGKPIADFANSDSAWSNVYAGLKNVLNDVIKIKQLLITENFTNFLQDTELLSRAHSQKERVNLEDIFIYPELSKFDDLKEYEKNIRADEVIENFYDYQKIIIAGENQSGKTTLCKKLFIELKKKNFIPIYVFDKTYQFYGKIGNRISEAYKEQYKITPLEEIDKQRIVPIIDDFHFAKNKEKHISDLSEYRHQIIIVDDIFNLNFKDENLINSFIHFKIEEFNPLLRNQLINKWTNLTDNKIGFDRGENSIYKMIDEKTELVNSTLGKIFGKGIMPAYPFFILSIINTYDTFANPLEEEITSQGYCYQAFIYMYLRKEGVKSDEIDTYINFLTEFAFLFHSKRKNEISSGEFDSFMKTYLDKYNLPVNQDVLLKKIQKSNLIALDNFNNYYFCYQYLYYFFVAKYLAEHIKDNKAIIDNIINNLHKDENAYIAIFISHHSKNEDILEEIILNALCLFDKYTPATLSDEELKFFSEQLENIIQATLPSKKETPEIERRKRLSAQNVNEKKTPGIKSDDSIEEYDDLAKQLRRGIKTVEVIGSIIKNRAGSLNKNSLKSMFEEAMNVHLRILTSFFKIIKSEEEQQGVINFISGRVQKIVENKAEERRSKDQKEREIPKEELEKISRTIFWNLNFLTIYGFIAKIISSLGSSKLTQIIEAVCDKKDTPASYLVKHGILMWYNKNLQIDNIAKKINEDGFSKIAKRIMKFLIADHCSMHKIDFKERQKIERIFGIPTKKMLSVKKSE
jgi:hypothetical protein